MDTCVFCRIIEKTLPADIIFENNDVLVIKDIAPKAPIHYLIMPKKHVVDIQSLKPEHYSMGSLLFETAQHLSRTVPQAEAFNMVLNNGARAGQVIFHLHAHFLAGRSLFDL